MLAACLVLGLSLRCCRLDQEAPWSDEIMSLAVLGHDSLGEALEAHSEIDHTAQPVYFALLYCWSQVAGESDVAVRALSVALGLLSIVAVYGFGKTLFGERAGLFAAFFMSASLVQVYYSQAIRMYALVTLLAICSTWAMALALERAQKRWWACNVVLNGLLVGTHLFGAFLLAAQGIYLLACRFRPVQRWLAWGVANLAALIPVGLWVVAHNPARAMARAESVFAVPTLRDLINTFLVFVGGRTTNWTEAPYLPGGIALDRLLAVVLAALITWWGFRVIRSARVKCENEGSTGALRHGVLLALWLGLPPVALFAASYLWTPCYLYRYVLYSAPALHLLTGAALASLPGKAMRLGLVSLVIVLCGYQLLALRSGPLRVDWYGAAAHVEESGTPDDYVLAFKAVNGVGFTHNADVSPERILTIEGFDELCAKAIELRGQGHGVWVVMFRWDHPEWFEERVIEAGYAFTLRRLGRWPYLMLYHLPSRMG